MWANIESFSQELEAQSDSLTDDEKAAKEEELNKMLAERAGGRRSGYRGSGEAQELRNIMIADLAQVLQVLSAEEGYDLILDTSVTHFYSQLIDITWEVIRKLQLPARIAAIGSLACLHGVVTRGLLH